MAADVNVRAGFMDVCERTEKLEAFVAEHKPTLEVLTQDSLKNLTMELNLQKDKFEKKLTEFKNELYTQSTVQTHLPKIIMDQIE